jgi:hypothetical protein
MIPKGWSYQTHMDLSCDDGNYDATVNPPCSELTLVKRNFRHLSDKQISIGQQFKLLIAIDVFPLRDR